MAPPWSLVPAETAALLHRHQLDLATEIVGEIETQVPEYARWDAPDRRAAAVETIRRAIAEFAGLMGGAAPAWPRHLLDQFAAVGEQEARAGRGLDLLQSVLRAGARAVLRWLAVQSERLRLPRSVYRAFAEAVFAALDEFATAAAEGHRRELTLLGGDRSRHRIRLLSLLTAEPPVPAEVIAEAALQADWTVPRALAALVFAPLRDPGPPPGEEPVPPKPPAEVLADLRGTRPWGLVPDPDRPGGLPFLTESPAPWLTVVGPTVPADEAADSLHWARQTLTLVERGIIALPAGPGAVVHCADHLPTLVLFQREELPRIMARRLLAPLLDLRPREAERLGRTLLACLQHGFNVKGAAGTLHVHPQTVRYRLHQLEDLFGEDLHAVDRRLEREMALHAWLATITAAEP